MLLHLVAMVAMPMHSARKQLETIRRQLGLTRLLLRKARPRSARVQMLLACTLLRLALSLMRQRSTRRQ